MGGDRHSRPHLTAFPRLEDFVFSMLSLLVVSAAIWAVTMPTDATVALTVTGVKPGSGKQVQIYGSLVDANGNPIHNAEIEVLGEDGGSITKGRTKSDGSFDLRFNSEPQTITLRITVMVDGVPVTGTVTMDVEPNMIYGVQIMFAEDSSFVFVPLPGY